VSLPAITERRAPRELPSLQVALTPDGDRAVAWGPDGLFMIERAGEPICLAAAEAEVAHAAPFADQLWTVTRRADAWWVASQPWAGGASVAPARLPALGGWVLGASTTSGPPAILVHGTAACEIRLEAKAWNITAIPCGADRPVLLGARTWIDRRGGLLAVVRSGRVQPIWMPVETLADGVVAGGGPIAGGSFAAIDVACRIGRRLLVIDVRDGRMVRVLQLDDARAVTVVPQPGHAVIASRDDRITIIDLLRNCCVGERVLGRGAALAVSGDGEHAAIADGDGLRRLRYAELLG
jgi:hypothetical protein